MITIKRSVFIISIAASLFIGSLTTGLMTNAADKGNSDKKYDYTNYTNSGFGAAIKGEDGEIKYKEDLKKLLDEGWRIHTSREGGTYLLERSR